MSNNFIRLADRVKEISYTTGTGNLSLNGAVAGFSSFRSALKTSTANVFYALTNGSMYEIGSGTYVSGIQDYLIRFPFNSSNNNNVVSLPEGVKEVYITYPATHSVYNGSGLPNFNNPQSSGIAFWQSPNMLNYDSNIIWNRTNKSLGINTNNPQYGIQVGGTGPSSLISSSGVRVGGSGIYFPPANDGDINYLGGRQLTHYEKNRLDKYAYDNSLIGQLTGSDSVIELSGVSNQYILFKKQTAGTVFAGPASGCTPPCSPGYPSFRPLTEEDIPDLSDLYASNSDLSNISGVFNNKITDSNSLSSTVSGILNSKIDNVSGVLNATINNSVTQTSGVLRNDLTIVSGLLPLYSNSYIAQGRLTLENGVAISTSDQTAKNILYYTPYNGNNISLYNGTKWETINFSQTSLTLTGLSSASNYDVFGYKSGSSLILELSIWSNGTTRATGLVLQDGVYCKSGALTRRYLGTIRTTSSTTTEDSLINRFVWNANNRISRRVSRDINGAQWTLSIPTTTSRSLSGAGDYSIYVINGLNENIINLNASVLYSNGNDPTGFYHLGIGKDSTTALIRSRINSTSNGTHRQLRVNAVDIVGLGYRSYIPLESLESATLTPTIYGTSFGAMYGTWEC
jgi:hypothetical protein